MKFDWIREAASVRFVFDNGIEHIDCLISYTYSLEEFLKKMGLLHEFQNDFRRKGYCFDCVMTPQLYKLKRERVFSKNE